MPGAKSKAALSHMLDPLSEDELEQTTFNETTMDSGIENLKPIPSSRQKAGAKVKPSTSNKATSARTATSKVTKAKAPPRRTSGGTSRKTTSKRSALAERNAPNESDTEEVEEFEEEAPPVKKKSRRVANVDDEEDPRKQAKRERARAQKPTTSRIKTVKRAPSAEPQSHRVIPDTQAEPMDIEQSIEEVTEYPVEPPLRRPAPRAESISRGARQTSKVRQTSVPRSRAGSISDPERRTHDPALRRKLGEITKRFENLDLKYRQLKEIGMRDAETNFEKLRKSTEQRAKGSSIGV